MNTQEAGEKVRQGRSVSTEQDSVRRLAEIRAREVITSHPLPLEVVGAVDVLCSMIDSLTAERDRLAAAGCPRCGHALRNEQDHALGSPCPMCGCMSTGGSDGAEAWRIRAEAAEAEVKRLRDALVEIRAFQYDDRLTSASAYSMCRIADAALATPPSEGEQS